MAGSTRIKGTKLSLKFGSPAKDYWCDVTSCTLTNEEADAGVVTFCDAADGGGRDFFLNIAGIQSTAADSFWRYVWEHTGEEVGFTYAPHGNEMPTADEPHFIGTVKVGPKPEVGGEAGVDNEYTFETQWKCIGTPVMEDGTTP